MFNNTKDMNNPKIILDHSLTCAPIYVNSVNIIKKTIDNTKAVCLSIFNNTKFYLILNIFCYYKWKISATDSGNILELIP
jgi:hypothetical protein